jgi:pseudouridine synthase
VLLDEKLTAPAQISVIRTVQDSTLLRIEMREGRKRQIRRVAALLGHPVRDLRRVHLGPLQLGSLEVGQWRYLTPKEIGQLESLKRQDEKRSNKGRGRQRRKR